ncbi:MAG: GNAT family N-acetyltransferase [Acidobacteria bacterium]|nr:GNAT family N-acetyltransferase [Acidobacteriota bacterium]
MRLTWMNAVPEQPEIREQWNALVFQMETPEVFYTWEWMAAFTRAYQGSVQPWIAIAYEGDELVGIAALVRSSETEASFLAGTTADYCDFISRPEKRKELVAQVLREVQEAGVHTLLLANLPGDSATVAEIKGNKSFKSFLRTGYICAQVQMGSEEDRRVLSNTVLKKKMLRRSLNTLRRIGPVTLQHDTSAGSKKSVIERFCGTHVARFLATDRISNLVSAQRRNFLVELAQLLGDQGWFDLMVLRAGSWVLALNYGFRFHGSWFWYQPTIINKYEELSPGYCMLAKIVEDACRNPEARVVDLGLGAEGYKERFFNAERTTLYATLASSGKDLWKVRARYYAAQAVKHSPRLEASARRLEKAIRNIRKRVAEDGWASVLGWAGQRLQRSFASDDEVLFFQWGNGADDPAKRGGLVPITWEILSAAAMQYSEDQETLDYLLRSATRFRANQSRGYALLAADGVVQHFAWAGPYEGFAMAELGETLRAPSTTSVMIFDCWTPRALRGQGLYARAITQLAGLLSAEGKDVWIFSAAANQGSMAGIQKAGFQRQASHFRRKILWWAKTRQETTVVSARAA